MQIHREPPAHHRPASPLHAAATLPSTLAAAFAIAALAAAIALATSISAAITTPACAVTTSALALTTSGRRHLPRRHPPGRRLALLAELRDATSRSRVSRGMAPQMPDEARLRSRFPLYEPVVPEIVNVTAEYLENGSTRSCARSTGGTRGSR